MIQSKAPTPPPPKYYFSENTLARISNCKMPIEL